MKRCLAGSGLADGSEGPDGARSWAGSEARVESFDGPRKPRENGLRPHARQKHTSLPTLDASFRWRLEGQACTGVETAPEWSIGPARRRRIIRSWSLWRTPAANAAGHVRAPSYHRAVRIVRFWDRARGDWRKSLPKIGPDSQPPQKTFAGRGRTQHDAG